MASSKAQTPVKPIDPRSEERTLISSPVEMRRFGHFSWEYRGTIADVSPSGIGVELSAVLAVGQVVELRFLNCDSPIVHRVRVVYRNNQRRYGMQFLDTDMRATALPKEIKRVDRDGAVPGSA